MADARRLRQSIEEHISSNSIVTIFQEFIVALHNFFSCYSYFITFNPMGEKFFYKSHGNKSSNYSLITRIKLRL
jgi:hypothetical protein